MRNVIVGLVFSALALVGCEVKGAATADTVDGEVATVATPQTVPEPVVCSCPPVVCDPADQCCAGSGGAGETPAVVPGADTAVVPPVPATPTPVAPAVAPAK